MIELELLPERTDEGAAVYRLTCAGRFVVGERDVIRAWFTVHGLPTPLLLDVLLDGVLSGPRPGLIARLSPTAALLERLVAEA